MAKELVQTQQSGCSIAAAAAETSGERDSLLQMDADPFFNAGSLKKSSSGTVDKVAGVRWKDRVGGSKLDCLAGTDKREVNA